MNSISDEKKFKRMSRRELLKLSPVLLMGVFGISKIHDPLLIRGQEFSDWISAKWFRKNHLAPTFSDSEVVPFSRFPLNSFDVHDPGVDLERWAFGVTGDVKNPGEYTLAQIQSLPKVRQNTKHVCVEGWDAVGNFGGARISDFLNMVGANTKAPFLYFECADDYYESLDMATAMQPQSLLCYEMYDKPLARGHGAPLRLILPTKIGYKSAKYLTSIKVTNILERRSYWADRGYSWYYGL